MNTIIIGLQIKTTFGHYQSIIFGILAILLCYRPRFQTFSCCHNQILNISTKVKDGEMPSKKWRRDCGRPLTTWIHQFCHVTGVTATEAVQLVEDKPF